MDKTQRIIICILGGVLAVTAILAFLAAADIINPQKVLEFVPPGADANAAVGSPDVPEELNHREMKINETFSVSMCATPVLEEQGVRLYVTSPDTNTAWVSVKVYDASGALIGQSGILRPGEYVEYVPLTIAPKKNFNVTVKILSYEPETYYSLGSADAMVTITVPGN